MKEEQIIVTYVYSLKDTKVVAKYVDESENELVDSETQTGKVFQDYTTEAKTIYGYKLKATPANATGKMAEETITVKYVYVVDENQTKDLKYTVEYYKDGVKQTGDTQTVTQTVQVLQPDTLTVDKTEINTTNKYNGYELQGTDPTTIPNTIQNGGIIKVYYVKSLLDKVNVIKTESKPNQVVGESANIVLVLDLSYSMFNPWSKDAPTTSHPNGDFRYNAAKEAAVQFINEIYKYENSNSTITLVTFNKSGEYSTSSSTPYLGTGIVTPPGLVNQETKNSLINKINSIDLSYVANIQSYMVTNYNSGLTKAKEVINSLPNNGNKNVVVFLSDGDPTNDSGRSIKEGSSNYNEIIKTANSIKQGGAELYTIGFSSGATSILRTMSSNNNVETSSSASGLINNFHTIMDQIGMPQNVKSNGGIVNITLTSNLILSNAEYPIVLKNGDSTKKFTELTNEYNAYGLKYNSATKTISWDLNMWNTNSDVEKITGDGAKISYYTEAPEVVYSQSSTTRSLSTNTSEISEDSSSITDRTVSAVSKGLGEELMTNLNKLENTTSDKNSSNEEKTSEKSIEDDNKTSKVSSSESKLSEKLSSSISSSAEENEEEKSSDKKSVASSSSKSEEKLQKSDVEAKSSSSEQKSEQSSSKSSETGTVEKSSSEKPTTESTKTESKDAKSSSSTEKKSVTETSKSNEKTSSDSDI